MDRAGRASGFRDHRDFPIYGYRSGTGNEPVASPQQTMEELEKRAQETSGISQSQAKTDAESIFELPGDASPSFESDVRGGFENDAPSTDPFGSSSSRDSLSGGRSNRGQTGPAFQGTLGSGQKSPQAPAGQTAGSYADSLRVSSDLMQPQNLDAEKLPELPEPDSITAEGPSEHSLSDQAKQLDRNERNWALPQHFRMRGNEIVRSIRIAIYPDRFELYRKTGVARFTINRQDVDSAALEMAASIRDQIQRWGTALPGARWVPVLKAEVAHNAEQQLSELRRSLIGSGLEIEALPMGHANSARNADARNATQRQRGSLR